MGINFSTKAIQPLINYKLGTFLIINKNINININKYENEIHSRSLINNEALLYNGLIQCLVNIGPLKDIFLNRINLYNKKINNEKKLVTMLFYKLMEYMWNSNNNNDDDKDYSFIFLIEIQTLSKKIGIFNDIDLLIGFILLSIHYEQQLNYRYNLKIYYSFYEFENNLNLFNNSFINDIFFFELDLEDKSKCKYKEFSSTHYMLSYNDNNLMELKEQNINIKTLFYLKTKIVCNKCNNGKATKLIFKSLPKILIISIQSTTIDNLKFTYNIEINLKKFCLNNKDNVNYKLISMIKLI